MRYTIVLLALVAVSFSGCKKFKFSGFKIKAVEAFRLPSAPDNSLLQFKIEGPGLNELTEWRNYSSTVFIETNFQGEKPKKDYDITLIRKTGNSETEPTKITFDLGDYLDQDAFFLENDDMRIKLYLEWNSRW